MRTVRVRDVVIGQGRPKICAPIAGKTTSEILAETRAVAESCAQIGELRIDWYEDGADAERAAGLLEQVRAAAGNMPLLFTFRTAGEGGEKDIDKELYTAINNKVIESGFADLVDIEWLTAGEGLDGLAEKARTYGIKTIISSHDFKKTPSKEALLNQLREMEKSSGDIIKLAVMPNSREDVFNLLQASFQMKEEAEKPVITMSMGREGLISRVGGEFFGSALTFGCVGRKSAPGQLQAEKLDAVLNTLHSPMPNLFFVGFMGAGKSTVAKELAGWLNASLIEMDEELEKRAGMPITKIFDELGEESFRNMESQLVREFKEKENCIVSCGGGTVLRGENVEAMKKCGRIIYLEAAAQTIYERVKDSEERPILNGNMNPEFIAGLIHKRKHIYEKAADYKISTDGRSVEEICRIINKIL